ncbi:hypothetical protein [Azospirillum soli]|uniref:hypothetical protein n=1 Tax=Azospirillum soli TaxID=1304799 RepID=UPI001FE3F68B|nr:hypothetical protein [Azospirillum soli]MBP2313382.1 hypothetical protein [Azospirillum soli]
MSRMPAVSPETPRAWVVFRGDAELWWLRLLKPGFRHCLALLNDGRRWVMVDPLATFMDVAVLDVAPGWDLPGWFRGQGMEVVAAPVRRGLTRPAPWGPFTCVEAVKRVLGLHAPFVVTPWQLYRRLTLSPFRQAPIREERPAHGQSVSDAAAVVAATSTPAAASSAASGGSAASTSSPTATAPIASSATSSATAPAASTSTAVRPAVVGDLPASTSSSAATSPAAGPTDTHEPGAGGAGSREGGRDGHAAAHAQPRGYGADLLARGAGHQRGGANAQAPARGMTR